MDLGDRDALLVERERHRVAPGFDAARYSRSGVGRHPATTCAQNAQSALALSVSWPFGDGGTESPPRCWNRRPRSRSAVPSTRRRRRREARQHRGRDRALVAERVDQRSCVRRCRPARCHRASRSGRRPSRVQPGSIFERRRRHGHVRAGDHEVLVAAPATTAGDRSIGRVDRRCSSR